MAAATPANNDRRSRATAARLAAVQALYQVEMGAAEVDAVLAEAARDGPQADLDETQRLDADPFVLAEIVRGAVDRRAAIGDVLEAALAPKWRLDRLDLILRAILRAGAFELLARSKVPARVVINEYVDITHAFFDKAEAGLVNAVLDRIAKTLRADEFAGKEPVHDA
ncbi:MAG: transcription antitermination factor NusB [Alphaproteobacteria bacterium]